MHKYILLLCSIIVFGIDTSSAATIPRVTSGSISHIELFTSKFVDARNIDIWLPDNYSTKKRYNVLYMHDGKALFDPFLMFHKQSWEMDATVSKLIKEGRIQDTIVVGIWNNEKFRHAEYYPQKHLEYLHKSIRNDFITTKLKNRPMADNYLKFIVTEVKPYIDEHFSTYTDRAHTFIMGSSMGGMISLYAIAEYPDVFGGAAALSTHWIGTYENNVELPLATFTYLQDHIPAPATHRIYMDHGTKDLDSNYAAHQAYVNEMFRIKGYNENNLMSKVFEGENHSENAWAKRVEIPLLFLLGTTPTENVNTANKQQ